MFKFNKPLQAALSILVLSASLNAFAVHPEGNDSASAAATAVPEHETAEWTEALRAVRYHRAMVMSARQHSQDVPPESVMEERYDAVVRGTATLLTEGVELSCPLLRDMVRSLYLLTPDQTPTAVAATKEFRNSPDDLFQERLLQSFTEALRNSGSVDHFETLLFAARTLISDDVPSDDKASVIVALRKGSPLQIESFVAELQGQKLSCRRIPVGNLANDKKESEMSQAIKTFFLQNPPLAMVKSAADQKSRA